MATTLVRRGKLLRPRPAPDLIARPRLIDRLTAGLDRPLTLVSTPAGYGKTTLLGQWLDAAPLPAAWLALDAHDNALPSFVAAVIGALSTLWPEAGRETLGLLQLPATPPPDYLGAALADELLDLPGPALLVLDDYHAVDDPAAHAFVAGLLEYPPPEPAPGAGEPGRAAAAAAAPAGARPGDRAAWARPGLHARGGAGVPGARGRRAGRRGGGGAAGAADGGLGGRAAAGGAGAARGGRRRRGWRGPSPGGGSGTRSTSCWTRCWRASRGRCRRSCCARRSSSGCAAHSKTRIFALFRSFGPFSVLFRHS